MPAARRTLIMALHSCSLYSSGHRPFEIADIRCTGMRKDMAFCICSKR